MIKYRTMNVFFTYLFIFLSTLFATTIGSITPYIFKNINKKIASFLSSFSVGIIISLLFLEIFPEAIEASISSFSNTTFGVIFALGIILVSGLLFFVLHEISHHLSKHHHSDEEDSSACEDHGHVKELIEEKEEIKHSSFIFLFAIFIHNIPEGLALGSSFDSSSFPINGAIMAFSLFIHNLIIGYSMSNSFKSGNVSKAKGILLTILSSLSSFVLALVGYYLSYSFNELISSIIYSIATGSLLYVLIIELLPQIFYEYKSKFSFLYLLLGIVLGALILLI